MIFYKLSRLDYSVIVTVGLKPVSSPLAPFKSVSICGRIAEPAATAIATAAAVRTTQSTVTAPDSSFAKFLIMFNIVFLR